MANMKLFFGILAMGLTLCFGRAQDDASGIEPAKVEARIDQLSNFDFKPDEGYFTFSFEGKKFVYFVHIGKDETENMIRYSIVVAQLNQADGVRFYYPLDPQTKKPASLRPIDGVEYIGIPDLHFLQSSIKKAK